MRLKCRTPLFLLIALLPFQLFSQEMYDEPWRWVHFTAEAGLPSNKIIGIVETADSTVWVSTANGLAWYDGYEWHAMDSTRGLPPGTPYDLTPGIHDSVLANITGSRYSVARSGFRRLPFTSAIPYSANTLLIVQHDRLYLYKEGTLEPFEHPLQCESTAPVTDLFQTKSGTIWAPCGTALYRLTRAGWIKEITPLVPFFTVHNIVENRRGEGLATISGFLQIFEWNAGGHPTPNPTELGLLAAAADITEEGDVIMALASGKTRIRRNGKWSELPYLQNSIHNITFIRFRDNGDLWVGTEQGLYLYRHTSTRWSYHNYPAPDQRNYVNAILLTGDGTLWLATGGGIEQTKPDGRTTMIDHIGSQALFAVTGLVQDDKGNIWVSSGSGFTGAFRWDGSTWKHFVVGNPTSRIYFHKIHKDRHGNLWFLGLRDTSQQSVQKEPGAFEYTDGRFIPWGVEQGLGSGRVYSFEEGRDGTLWFGTLKHLERWKDGHWIPLSSAKGLQDYRTFALALDSTGNLWFANGNRGIGYVDKEDRVSFLSTSDGLINNIVREIAHDKEGRVWIATERGLSCYKDGSWSNFDFHNGLSDPFIWPIFINKDKVYIGTVGNGLAILDLTESRLPKPKVRIDNPIIEEDKALIRWHVFSYWGTDATEDLQVRFRLDGQRWSPWTTDREKILRELAPGNHAFEVQAKNSFGNLNEMSQLTSFDVPRPWYRHPLYLTPLAILFLGILILSTILTLRKRKHGAEVRKSELRFRRLTESTFEGIVIHDNGNILELNRSALEMFGYTYEEVTNRSMLDFMSPESRETVRRNVSNNFLEQYEAMGIRKDGSKIALEIIGRPIPYDDRTVRVDAIRDITERKLAEKKLLDYQEQLRQLASQLSATEERERRRMATYLHDYIGHTLALCKLKLAEIPDAAVNEKLGEVEGLINETINNSRSFTFELSPPVLSSFQLEDAIEWLVEHFQETHNLLISYEKGSLSVHLPDDLRSFLYYTVRELLVNVVKHAKAKSAEVALRQVENKIEIRVRDEGCGFDPASVDPKMRRVAGFGLFNLQERVTHYGGTVNIQSHAGVGTTISIVVPFSLGTP